MRRLFILLLLVSLNLAVVASPEFRILKFWTESETYLPFEPIIMHAFVLNQEGSPATPLSGVKIRIRVNGENFSKSVLPEYDTSRNHYVVRLGLLKQGKYDATLFVEKDVFIATQDLSFIVKSSPDILPIELDTILNLKRGDRAAKQEEIMIWIRNLNPQNVTIHMIDKNATETEITVSDGETGSLEEYLVEILRISDTSVKLRLRKSTHQIRNEHSIQHNTNQNNNLSSNNSITYTNIQETCEGCRSDDGNCRLIGSHYVKGVEAVYCSEDKQPVLIKTFKQGCKQDYECVEYSCFKGLCQPVKELSLWQQVIEWINSLFSR
ncbi:MAG: hypothetical protein AABX52_02020 [Nanoarchaeota archaeon]